MKNTIQKQLVVGRTVFAGDIVAEFWMPKKASGRAIIICDGAPSVPSKKKLAEFFARKGYWVFHMRYRGTWESAGEFLKKSPAEDVRDVVEGLTLGFSDVYTGTTYYLDIREVVLIGASFAGPAVILGSRLPQVTKVIAIAPVVDWNVETKEEPFAIFVHQLTMGFPGAYRAPLKNFKKLLTKRFYNPVDWTDKLDGKKLFLIHACDDTSVSHKPTKAFAKKTKATYVEYKKGGHLSSSLVMDSILWKRIDAFLNR